MIWPFVTRTRFAQTAIELDFVKSQQAKMVDREAFDLLMDERDRLREQNDFLLQHIKRMDRIEHGISEEERQKREEYGQMPMEMVQHFNKWPAATRKHQIDLAWNERKSGRSWDDIWNEIQKKRRERDG